MLGKREIAVVCIGLMVVLMASGCATTGTRETSSDSSLSDVINIGKFVVGTAATYPPMEFRDESGDIIGFDADLAEEIASAMGVSLELVHYEWEPLFGVMKSGEVDVAMSSITITPERQEEMLFSVPYFNGGQVMLVRSGYTDVNVPEDLAGKKVGVQAGTTCEDAAVEYADPELLMSFGDSVDAIEGLLNGTVDVVVVDYVAAVGYIDEKNDSLEIAGEPFTQEFYGIATELGNEALMNEINGILRDMKRSGKLEEIKDKWLG